MSLSDIGSFFGGIGDSIGNIFSGGSSGSPDLTSPDVNVPDTSSTLPGLDTGMNVTPLSFANSATTTPGISTTPYNLGGVAAPSDVTSFLNGSTSTSSTPFSALNPTGENQGQGPTASLGASISGQQQSSGSSNDILQALGLGTGNQGLDKTLLTAGVSGGGLLANLLMGGGSTSAEKSLKNIAGAQSAQGQQLENYLATGTLPPGAQQWVNDQTQANQAAIRAQFAQQGLTGSSMEQEALANAQNQATETMFQIASSLLNSGISETNASGTLYNYLMQAQNQDQQQVSSAIQNFVSSLAGGGSPNAVTLNLAGKT